jgi:radical SAM protein with 4Fe4S-binding SPASM domain
MWNQLKILSHKDVLRTILAGEPAFPLHVQIELTEACNFRCVFCPWHGPAERRPRHVDFTGKRFFDTPRLLALIGELEQIGVKAVAITGTGENLLHPEIEKITARLASSSMDFALTSNCAVKLSDRTLKNLLRAKWIRWSVNAGDEATFRDINRPRARTAYRAALDNVRRLVRLKAGSGAHIGASFVISNGNGGNILPVARLMREMGVDSLSFRPDVPLERTGSPPAYGESVLADLRGAEALQTERFRVFSNLERLEDRVAVTDRDLVCYYSNHSVYIAAHGDVYPCCMTRHDRRYAMGNIMETSFRDFWSSAERMRHYETLTVAACPPCMHTRTNEILKYFYEDTPRDNFI